MYYLPAEWSPQSATLLTWPHQHTDWISLLAEVEQTYCDIARAIATYQAVFIICQNTEHQKHIEDLLLTQSSISANIQFCNIPYNDTWIRDYGPICVNSSKEPVSLDFVFNGWGDKFKSDLDNQCNEKLSSEKCLQNYKRIQVPQVLEGGSIDVNGEGCLLTTEKCLLNPNRNPDLTRHDYKILFKKFFSIKKTHWLKHGQLEGDDTDSHIDILARFVDKNKICYTSCDNNNDTHYDELMRMAEELQTLKNQHNESYEFIPLPWPSAKYNKQGNRLPASYANFIILNNAVLVPQYQDAADNAAIQCLQSCFPERDIVGINSLHLIEQGGSLHCASMQIPK